VLANPSQDLQALETEAAWYHNTTWHHSPEDLGLNLDGCENLKSHTLGSHSGCITPRKRSGTAGLNRVIKRKILPLPETEPQLSSHFTDW